MNRAFIIHGWDDSPHNGWFPWLKNELTSEGLEVHVPSMPDPEHPQIDTWVPFLQHLVGAADRQTYFVGHSIGCQAILRYLETLPENVVVGGVVLVAAWVTLKPAAVDDETSVVTATPWLQRPLDWPKIRSHAAHFAAIMSDDDPYVPIEDGKVFQRELGATMTIEHRKGHLGGADGITALARVHLALREMLTPAVTTTR